MNFLRKLFSIDNPELTRRAWIEKEVGKISENGTILDAGCGTQPYREFCEHLNYKAQDFGQYEDGENGQGLQHVEGSWNYGKLDYVGDIWNIDEKDGVFDAILCSEVIEHVPYPEKTIKELCRLLKKDGKLLLTAPYACLPHMNPYFFYSGFSAEFYKHHFEENGVEVELIEGYGDIYIYLFQEIKRSITMVKSKPVKLLYTALVLPLLPVLKWMSSRYGQQSDAQMLKFGYLVVGRKKS